MVIIIDGYNVLKMAIKPEHVDERERSSFIASLVAYVRVVGNRIIVVFDGGQEPRPIVLHKHGVTVIYSGYKDSADTVIKHLLDERAHGETLLVSTDRELNRYAERIDIPSMDATVFYSYLKNRSDKTISRRATDHSCLRKLSQDEENATLDALMESGTRAVARKDEDHCPALSKDKPSQKSKMEKRLEQMVKKL